MSAVDQVLNLLRDGWEPFRGQVVDAVYDELRCPHVGKARWFSKGDKYLCVGSRKQCVWARGRGGFQAALPIDVPLPNAGIGDLPSMTPAELLLTFTLLRKDQTRYCLTISDREYYRRCKDGRLVTAGGSGGEIRVTARSVLRQMLLDDEGGRLAVEEVFYAPDVTLAKLRKMAEE